MIVLITISLKKAKGKKTPEKKMKKKSTGKEYLVKPSCWKIKQKYPYIVYLMRKSWIEI